MGKETISRLEPTSQNSSGELDSGSRHKPLSCWAPNSLAVLHLAPLPLPWGQCCWATGCFGAAWRCLIGAASLQSLYLFPGHAAKPRVNPVCCATPSRPLLEGLPAGDLHPLGLHLRPSPHTIPSPPNYRARMGWHFQVDSACKETTLLRATCGLLLPHWDLMHGNQRTADQGDSPPVPCTRGSGGGHEILCGGGRSHLGFRVSV